MHSKKQKLSMQLFVFMLVRTVFNSTYRMVYPLLPIFSRALGVDINAISLALTTRSVLGAFGTFLGSVADYKGRRAGMLFGLVIYTVGVSVVIISPTFLGFTIALVMTTLGKYVFDPAMQAYLGDSVPYGKRGLALAVTEVGWSLSFIAGVPFVAYLIAKSGWISPFWLFMILGGIMIGLIAWLIQPGALQEKRDRTFLQNATKVLKGSTALWGLAIGIFASAANEVVNLIFGVWLKETFGLQLLALGGASAVIGFAELGGESLVGIFTDRIGKVRSVGLGLILNSFMAVALVILGKSVSGALLGLFLFYLTFEFTLVASIPMMTEILPEMRATMMAFNVAGLSLGRAIGAFVAVPIYAWGLLASVLAAAIFNGFAFVAVRFVSKKHA